MAIFAKAIAIMVLVAVCDAASHRRPSRVTNELFQLLQKHSVKCKATSKLLLDTAAKSASGEKVDVKAVIKEIFGKGGCQCITAFTEEDAKKNDCEVSTLYNITVPTIRNVALLQCNPMDCKSTAAKGCLQKCTRCIPCLGGNLTTADGKTCDTCSECSTCTPYASCAVDCNSDKARQCTTDCTDCAACNLNGEIDGCDQCQKCIPCRPYDYCAQRIEAESGGDSPAPSTGAVALASSLSVFLLGICSIF